MSTPHRILTRAALIGCLGLAAASCSDDDDMASPASDAGAGRTAEGGAGASGRAGSGRAGSGRAGSGNAGGAAAGRDAAVPADAGAPQDVDGGDDERAITVRFRAVVGKDELACGRDYAGVGKSQVKVTPLDLRLYVQELKLRAANGREVPVRMDERTPWQTPDVALLDFEDGTGNCYGDAVTNKTITGHVANGDYTSLSFVIGVPDKLNHADPTKQPKPLQAPGMSWTWLLGYRFLKVELAEVANDADADAGVGRGAFHLGSVGCKGNPSKGDVTCAKPNRIHVDFAKFDLEKNAVALDLATLFAGMDLSQDAECHSADAVCETGLRTLGIDFATGATLDAQSAFKAQ